VQIGSSNNTLSANTTVTANAVNNTGAINLYGNGSKQAALKVSGAAGFGTAGVISGRSICRTTAWCSLAAAD
jgi:hypothetical protein